MFERIERTARPSTILRLLQDRLWPRLPLPRLLPSSHPAGRSTLLSGSSSFLPHAPAPEICPELICKSATRLPLKHLARSSPHRVTPWIFGTSPGSRMAYDTPLNVVPTSKARTRARVAPRYGFRVSLVSVISVCGQRTASGNVQDDDNGWIELEGEEGGV